MPVPAAVPNAATQAQQQQAVQQIQDAAQAKKRQIQDAALAQQRQGQEALTQQGLAQQSMMIQQAAAAQPQQQAQQTSSGVEGIQDEGRQAIQQIRNVAQQPPQIIIRPQSPPVLSLTTPFQSQQSQATPRPRALQPVHICAIACSSIRTGLGSVSTSLGSTTISTV